MFNLHLSDGMTPEERKKFVVIPPPKKVTPWDKTVVVTEIVREIEVKIIKVPTNNTTLTVSLITAGLVCLLGFLVLVVYSLFSRKKVK